MARRGGAVRGHRCTTHALGPFLWKEGPDASGQQDNCLDMVDPRTARGKNAAGRDTLGREGRGERLWKKALTTGRESGAWMTTKRSEGGGEGTKTRD